jgi:hypothetical protein
MEKVVDSKKVSVFEKIFNVLGMLIISAIIITFNLIIGANEKELRILPISIFLAIIIIYLIIKKIISKGNIVIKSKLDIFVLLFMLSTILPLIFKTYCTYQGTVEFILKYFFVYVFYLLVRNVVDSKRKVGVAVTVTIFASLIPMILGLYIKQPEILKNKIPAIANFLNTMLRKLNLVYTTDYRLSSTFGYANAVSMYAVFCTFLAVNKLENNKNKILKFLDLIYIGFASYIIYVSYSRTILVAYVFSIILYVTIKILKKVKKSEKIHLTKKHLTILGVSILAIIFVIILFMVSVGLKYSEPYQCNEDTSTKKIRYNFEPNTDYEILLNMSYVDDSQEEKKEVRVELLECNEYLYTQTLTSMKVEDLSQPIKLNFTTSEDKILYIQLRIVKNGTGTVNINNCYINGEEYILKYKYLPKVISRLIVTATTKDESLVQRGHIYSDCLKIAKGHWIIGQGGNTWKKLNTAVEDYIYAVKETHSYFFELLISYGIVGVSTFVLLITYTLIKLIKELRISEEARKEKLLIVIGLFLSIIYSFVFDFNMSFLVILLTTFEYIALLNYNLNDEKNDNDFKYLDYFILIASIFVLSIYIMADIAKYSTDDNKIKVVYSSYNAKNNFEYINEQTIKNEYYLKNLIEFMKKEPYYNQLTVYELYWQTLLENLDNFSDEKLENYINFGIETFKEILPAKRMYSDEILGRAELMSEIISKLNIEGNETRKNITQNAINEIKKIMKKEYDENIVNLKAQSRNHLGEKTIERLVEEYDEIMEEIENIKLI